MTSSPTRANKRIAGRLGTVGVFALLAAVGGGVAGEAKGPAPAAKPAIAFRADKPPVIDGVLDEGLWTRIKTRGEGVVSDFITRGNNAPPQCPRRFYLAYDDENLYIGGEIESHDSLELVLAESPTMSDNAEFFFVLGGEHSQLTLDLSERVTFSSAIRANIANKHLSRELPAEAVRRKVVIDETRWTCELAIPWSCFLAKPKAGDTIPFNVGSNFATQAKGIRAILQWGRSAYNANGQQLTFAPEP